MNSRPTPVLLLVPLLLAGCDLLGIEGASVVAARKEAESKAVGAACRHAGRAIEDCFALNKRADKGAVFAGWREMNDYMTENKIEVVPPATTAATATEPVARDGDPLAAPAPKKTVAAPEAVAPARSVGDAVKSVAAAVGKEAPEH